jgi:hypothetical protein
VRVIEDVAQEANRIPRTSPAGLLSDCAIGIRYFVSCYNVARPRSFSNQVDDDGESYWVFESRDVSDILLGLNLGSKQIT